MTRLLLILLAASFALTVLAVLSEDPVAERRALPPATPEQSATAPAAPRHAGPGARDVPAPAMAT